jgi:hypothetical protein
LSTFQTAVFGEDKENPWSNLIIVQHFANWGLQNAKVTIKRASILKNWRVKEAVHDN